MSQPSHIYEQPLNERIRALLRLEFLFERAQHCLTGDTLWDSRATLDAIIDIMALMGRADLKTELIKELERQAATLESLTEKRGVDHDRLAEILGEIRRLLGALRGSDNMPGQELRNHDLLSYVRQRSSIPAGTCSFDVPAYQHWLERPAEERRADLAGWFQVFDGIREAVGLCLTLVRESASATREVAEGGFFQRSLEAGTSCQLVRVVMTGDGRYFPEISGGKHRFTVRFMEHPDPAVRPVQTGDDVAFRLLCCII